MSKYTKALLAAILVFAATGANAKFIDFAAMGNTSEFGMQPLNIDVGGGITLDIYGYSGSDAAHAYLDAGTGGLGVCKVLDSANQCDPTNDDNVTEGEWLEFVFTGGTVVLDSISFNNNHDSGFFAGFSKINVDGNPFTMTTGGTNTVMDPLSGARVSSFTAAFNNSMFYVQSINVVPEPAGIALLGLGLLGFAVTARRTRKAKL